ncbi:group II intron maturase-specific domain-containing protein [Rhodopirellula baltica]|nr:group II intron maturase-specific domain-containing protein [Rhodopirellula baltica]
MTFLTAASLYSRLNVRRLSMDRFSCQRSLTCAGPLSTFRGQFHFKQRASEIFRKSRGVSMKSRLSEFRSYAMGWMGYFALDQVRTTFVTLDKWLRRRVRACYWKQWKKSKTRLKHLISLGVSYRVARGFAMSGKGAWRLSMTSGVQRALSIEYLTAEGLLNLEERWHSFAPLRRTA